MPRKGLVCILTVAALLPSVTMKPVVAAELFVDRAAEWGLDFVHFNGMSGHLYFSEMMGSGVAFVDYDQDGDVDIYLVQGTVLGDESELAKADPQPRHPWPLTDRLYRTDLFYDAQGTVQVRFVDVTEAARIDSLGYGMGVAVGDIDNDGYPDLYVTNAGPNHMMRNQGDGTFRGITEESGTGDRKWGVSATFVDYDGDGFLDLYSGNYVEYRLATDKKCFATNGRSDYCGPLAYQSEVDTLYRNRGDLDFEDVSVASGIRAEAPGNGLGVVGADFNRDGWMDIYVANDQVPNKMWMNRGDGTFFNDAILSGTAVNEAGQPEASMGLVVGDFNGDGFEDLFMSHLNMETNTLYLNDGTGLFVDATRDSGLGHASWNFTGFGIALFDYDLDGHLDLYIANGAVRLIEELRRINDPYPIHQTNQLFHSLGGARFAEVTDEAGSVFALSEVSRGVSRGDIDGDGDPDLMMSNSSAPARLLVNEGQTGNSWLGVALHLGSARRTVIGSMVEVAASERTQRRRVSTDGSYASAHDPRALFGLGGEQGPLSVRVDWVGGGSTELRGIPVNRMVNMFQRAP